MGVKYEMLRCSKPLAKINAIGVIWTVTETGGIMFSNKLGHFDRALYYVLSQIYCAIIYPFL
jgi:hypothetical protein